MVSEFRKNFGGQERIVLEVVIFYAISPMAIKSATPPPPPGSAWTWGQQISAGSTLLKTSNLTPGILAYRCSLFCYPRGVVR